MGGKVSVLMSMYHEEINIIETAIKSVLNQTYGDIELVLVLDAPERADVVKLIHELKKRCGNIILIINGENLGLVKSLNIGLKGCTGDYIARMDADDISLPQRIEIEVKLLENSCLDFVGTYIESFKNENQHGKIIKCPVLDTHIKKYIRFENCVKHPTWLVKREVYDSLDGYRDIDYCEDYDFILRAMMAGYKFGNVPEVGLRYRFHQGSISRKNSASQYATFIYLGNCYKRGYIPEFEEYRNYLKSDERLELIRKYREFNKAYTILNENHVIKLNDICHLIFSEILYRELYRKFLCRFYMHNEGREGGREGGKICFSYKYREKRTMLMKSHTISVIVPVYNVDIYIRKCIDSILAQTYTNLEIILVDDGSTDSSGMICDEYARKDRRVKVIHKANGGVSSARNAGLEVMLGEYVCFVDADDYVNKDYINVLVELSNGGNVDFVCTSFVFRKRFGRCTEYVQKCFELKGEEINKGFFYFLNNVCLVSWAKLYRVEIIKKFGIRFPDEVTCGEDTLFNVDYYEHISSIVVSEKIAYNYNIANGNSAVNNLHRNMNRYLKMLFDAECGFVQRNLDIAKYEQHLQQAFDECFLNSIAHYIINEKDSTELIQEIKETVEIFGAKNTHGNRYYELANNGEWEGIANKWKKDHIRTYVITRIKQILFG